MKKIFGMTLALSLSLALVACGGGSSANDSQAAVSAGVIAPALANAVGSISSVDVNESGTIAIDFDFACPTSGTAKTTGSVTYVVTDTAAEINGDMATVFTSCAGTDDRCAIDYILGGTVNSTTSAVAAGYDVKIKVTQSGTVNVSGFATFDCAVDTITEISYNDVEALDTADIDVIFNYMTGTICGKTIAEIKALIDGDDATYCAGVQEVAGENA